jgi:hypothetical protein
MVEPLTMIVIPLVVTFSAIMSAQAVTKRWNLRNDDDGNKYSRFRQAFKRKPKISDSEYPDCGHHST